MNNKSIEQLKEDIHLLMKEYFNHIPSLNHDVAYDFSETELDKFIDIYVEYLYK